MVFRAVALLLRNVPIDPVACVAIVLDLQQRAVDDFGPVGGRIFGACTQTVLQFSRELLAIFIQALKSSGRLLKSSVRITSNRISRSFSAS